jgi:hypothetical protein
VSLAYCHANRLIICLYLAEKEYVDEKTTAKLKTKSTSIASVPYSILLTSTTKYPPPPFFFSLHTTGTFKKWFPKNYPISFYVHFIQVDQDAAEHLSVYVVPDHNAGGLRQILGHLPTYILSGTVLYADKKDQIFLTYKKTQNGAVAKSYMRKGFLIYEEMRKYFTVYEELRRPLVIYGLATAPF